MSKGDVGKRAVSGIAADLALTKVLDFMAVHQPRLWDTIRQLVTPHPTLAKGGMAAIAEVTALLKDNLRFLPEWTHQLIDAGLAQSPMTIVNYFSQHQARQDVVDQLRGSFDQIDEQVLVQKIQEALIASPEFQEMARDAESMRLLRRAEKFQAAVKASMGTDFRYALAKRYGQELEKRCGQLSESDKTHTTDFLLWFIRQHESVGAVLSHLMAATVPITEPLDLLSLPGLRQFCALEESDRLATMMELGRLFDASVVPPPALEIGGPNEPTDPVERYHYRQQVLISHIGGMTEKEFPGIGSTKLMDEQARAIYQSFNGQPLGPEQEVQWKGFLAKVDRLNQRRRKALALYFCYMYAGLILKTSDLSPKTEASARQVFTPAGIASFTDVEMEELESETDEMAVTMDFVGLMATHAISGLMEVFGGPPKEPPTPKIG